MLVLLCCAQLILPAMATWGNENTFRFLELYQGEPIIWDPKNKFHKEKAKVNDAWVRISNIMEIGVSELKKKKESLMACFRNHLKKKRASIKSGAGQEEIYKPIWTFYEVMEGFLLQIYECAPTLNTEDNIQDSQNPVEEEEAGSTVDSVSNSTSPRSTPTPEIHKGQRRRVSNPELHEAGKHVRQAFTTLSNVLTQRCNKERGENKEDECDLYAKLLATKLRKISETDRAEVMYEIDGMLLKRARQSQKKDYCAGASWTTRQSTTSSPMTSPYSAPSPTQIQNPTQYATFTSLTPYSTLITREPSIQDNSSFTMNLECDEPSSKISVLSQHIIMPPNEDLIGEAYSKALNDEEANAQPY